MCWKVPRLLRPGTGCSCAATPKTTQSAHLHVGLAEKLVLPFVFLLLSYFVILCWFGRFLVISWLYCFWQFLSFLLFFVSSLIVFLYVRLFVCLSFCLLSICPSLTLSSFPFVRLSSIAIVLLSFFYPTQAQSVSVTRGSPFLKCVGSIKWALSKQL